MFNFSLQRQMIIKPHSLWLQLTKTTMIYFLKCIICSPLLFSRVDLVISLAKPPPDPAPAPFPAPTAKHKQKTKWMGGREREREMRVRSRNVEYTEQTKSYTATVALWVQQGRGFGGYEGALCFAVRFVRC